MKIGEKIAEKIKVYFELYLSLKKDGCKEALGLAKYDLIIEKYIASRALEGLVEKIQEVNA